MHPDTTSPSPTMHCTSGNDPAGLINCSSSQHHNNPTQLHTFHTHPFMCLVATLQITCSDFKRLPKRRIMLGSYLFPYLCSLFLYCIWKQRNEHRFELLQRISVSIFCMSESRQKVILLNTESKTKWIVGKTKEEGGGGESTLKYSSCKPRTIGRVWWVPRIAVIVGVQGVTVKMKQCS